MNSSSPETPLYHTHRADKPQLDNTHSRVPHRHQLQNTSVQPNKRFRKRITSAVIFGPSSELGRLISARCCRVSDEKCMNIDLSFSSLEPKYDLNTRSPGAL